MINELQELDDTAVGSPSWMRHYQQIANDSLALVADLARTKWLEAPELANENRAAIAAVAKLAALMAVDEASPDRLADLRCKLATIHRECEQDAAMRRAFEGLGESDPSL